MRLPAEPVIALYLKTFCSIAQFPIRVHTRLSIVTRALPLASYQCLSCSINLACTGNFQNTHSVNTPASAVSFPNPSSKRYLAVCASEVLPRIRKCLWWQSSAILHALSMFQIQWTSKANPPTVLDYLAL